MIDNKPPEPNEAETPFFVNPDREFFADMDQAAFKNAAISVAKGETWANIKELRSVVFILSDKLKDAVERINEVRQHFCMTLAADKMKETGIKGLHESLGVPAEAVMVGHHFATLEEMKQHLEKDEEDAAEHEK
jgi:hypothetical protein